MRLAESILVGRGPCHTFIESCPQSVLRTVRVVIQPENSGCEKIGTAIIWPQSAILGSVVHVYLV